MVSRALTGGLFAAAVWLAGAAATIGAATSAAEPSSAPGAAAARAPSAAHGPSGAPTTAAAIVHVSASSDAEGPPPGSGAVAGSGIGSVGEIGGRGVARDARSPETDGARVRSAGLRRAAATLHDAGSRPRIGPPRTGGPRGRHADAASPAAGTRPATGLLSRTIARTIGATVRTPPLLDGRPYGLLSALSIPLRTADRPDTGGPAGRPVPRAIHADTADAPQAAADRDRPAWTGSRPREAETAAKAARTPVIARAGPAGKPTPGHRDPPGAPRTAPTVSTAVGGGSPPPLGVLDVLASDDDGDLAAPHRYRSGSGRAGADQPPVSPD